MKTVTITAALTAAFTLSAWGHSAPPLTGQFAASNWSHGESRYPLQPLKSDPDFETIARADATLDRERLFNQVDQHLGGRLEAQLQLAIDADSSSPGEGVGTN